MCVDASNLTASCWTSVKLESFESFNSKTLATHTLYTWHETAEQFDINRPTDWIAFSSLSLLETFFAFKVWMQRDSSVTMYNPWMWWSFRLLLDRNSDLWWTQTISTGSSFQSNSLSSLQKKAWSDEAQFFWASSTVHLFPDPNHWSIQ